MILQALCRYYERRNQHPDRARHLPRFGFEEREVPYVLELAPDGTLKAITTTGRREGKKLVGQRYSVPMGVKKTSGIAANLLWDNAEYVLALPDPKKLEAAQAKSPAKAEDYRARLLEMQAAFAQRIAGLAPGALAHPGVQAALAFLKTDTVAALHAFPQEAAEIAASNPVLSFRLWGELDLVCEHPDVCAAVVPQAGSDEDEAAAPATATVPSACLITGNVGEVERLHTAIKGVWGAQTSGANIVSFNAPAYQSHGKEQGANAPVSPAAAFAYTTALNALLAKDSRQRMQVGDASTVFWAEAEDPLENAFGLIFGTHTDDPNAHTDAVRALYASVRSGAFTADRGERRFYVLGLSPNAARLAVRFWHVGTVAEAARHITQWFDDLDVVRSERDAPYLGLFRLLASTALQGKADHIPPRLGGDVLRAVLAGTPLPATLLNAAVQRSRAERKVTHPRAALIKACINRMARQQPSSEEELPVMLDPALQSPAYRLGRLFATLEKIQEEASPGLNVTIRERYYGAASSTPVTVFTTLMRLKNHHLAKLGKGRAVNLEKLLGDIMSGIQDFPAHLPLPEQGRFAVGYYHQRQAFFTKAPAASDAGEPAETSAN
jgi:CRISPR-associated protein Csd1